MCVEIPQTPEYNKMDISNKRPTTIASYSMKKLLKQIFKQQKSKKIAANSMDSQESLENSRKASLESDCSSSSMESFENDINEQISAEEEQQTYVPVHFIRTQQGTFFWTSASDYQLTCLQQQDRWAQA
ncbi:enhancer of split m4 protein-like [Musca domestica]|uniref:Enhancer of split m4 protein-like n=1 Tax=Musca domestica TaxID=7370 RepID=A0A9J7CYH7_MUSDO|nr:enhancer of split m4 protein-like [Musca domestica]